MHFNTFGVANLVVSTVPCSLQRVQGYFRGAADRWLQIHDSPVEPATDAVPLRSYALTAESPFSWAFDPGALVLYKGCWVGVSSTEGTYTADAGLADWEGDYGPYDFKPSDYSVAGDLTTGVDYLFVWNEATGPKKLYQIDYTNNDGDVRYLQLFALDSVAVTDKPIQQWKVAAGASLSLIFGGGLHVFTQTSAGAAKEACTLYQSSTPEVLTDTSSTASFMRAYYK